jgi:hypothetical protein
MCGHVRMDGRTLITYTHTTITQAVLSLSMAEWQELVEAFGVEDPKVPHRDGYKKGTSCVYLLGCGPACGVVDQTESVIVVARDAHALSYHPQSTIHNLCTYVYERTHRRGPHAHAGLLPGERVVVVRRGPGVKWKGGVFKRWWRVVQG